MVLVGVSTDSLLIHNTSFLVSSYDDVYLIAGLYLPYMKNVVREERSAVLKKNDQFFFLCRSKLCGLMARKQFLSCR